MAAGPSGPGRHLLTCGFRRRAATRSLAGESSGEVPMAAYVAKQAVRARRPAVSADTPILASRITVPNTPHWTVQRPQITKLIADGTRWCQLTVLTGPAGAGKTIAWRCGRRRNPGLWPGSQTLVG